GDQRPSGVRACPNVVAVGGGMPIKAGLGLWIAALGPSAFALRASATPSPAWLTSERSRVGSLGRNDGVSSPINSQRFSKPARASCRYRHDLRSAAPENRRHRLLQWSHCATVTAL